MKSSVFQIPKPVSITARTSAITNAFINSIIPVEYPTEDEIKEALSVLGMSEETIRCAYCGSPHTEWDHLFPLVKGKHPTGYITEIHNLVPCCGKCNQSKGNKNWLLWMTSDAKLSPKSRGVVDIDERIEKLKEYERRFERKCLNIENIVGQDNWEIHMRNLKELHEKMVSSQEFAKVLNEKLKAAYKNSI